LFSEPNFRGVVAKGVNFSHCRIYGMSMMGKADLENADFSKSSIELLDIQSANLKNAKFYDTSLKSVNFGHADLTNADFTNGAFADFVRLTDAKLEGTKFTNVNFYDNPEVDLKDTIYEGKSLPGVKHMSTR
jgi:uncharacterized protein YjbI with pentapeptide repeats